MPAITSVTQLQNINNDLAGHYWLSNDIDASATVGWNGGAGFVPIGQGVPYFTGIFNARKYIISDLTINRPGSDNVGLFGVADTGSEISNVILENVSISGSSCVGALVGLSNSKITNCHVDGSVTAASTRSGGLIGDYLGADVNNSSSDIILVSASNIVGGLIGRLNLATAVITKCHAIGSVTAVQNYVGGLIGRVYSGAEVSECYALGNVVSTFPADRIGGLVGYVDNNAGLLISDSYARGNVTGDDYIAGFASYLGIGNTIQHSYSTGVPSGDTSVRGFCAQNSGTITDCFWDIETSGTAVSEGGTGKTTAQMKTKSTFTSAGWDFIVIWGINGITNNGYPFHWAMPPEPPPDAPRRTVSVEEKITLETIRNVEMAAMGRFRIGEDGKATYRSRYARNP